MPPPPSATPHAAAPSLPNASRPAAVPEAEPVACAPAWGAPHPMLATHAAGLAFSMRLPGWQEPPQGKAAMVALSQALALRLSLRPDLSLGLEPARLPPPEPAPSPATSPAPLPAGAEARRAAAPRALPDRSWFG
ncbi:hypothetical protein CR162_05370 [Pseudoroseomonas rhizosphaerae]|uniref:Uncharacterized protein n=1 Tax=Teichococcus rhizosphaerae TaxID=1335062 RepID=A0A2C7AFU7_9PROT|nr:hypothetical protein [Pseudoroseomonas rhizosphaerae]PHK96026.1 hypothetical protein CR162_05370 [Pseudoroseomonas rhizosphaerae]